MKPRILQINAEYRQAKQTRTNKILKIIAICGKKESIIHVRPFFKTPLRLHHRLDSSTIKMTALFDTNNPPKK